MFHNFLQGTGPISQFVVLALYNCKAWPDHAMSYTISLISIKTNRQDTARSTSKVFLIRKHTINTCMKTNHCNLFDGRKDKRGPGC